MKTHLAFAVVLLLAGATAGQLHTPTTSTAPKSRVVTQDFRSGSWVDTSGNCQHVTTKLSADNNAGENATIHAAAVEAMLTQYPPAIVGCAGDNDDDIGLPFAYQDLSIRTHGASSAAGLASLQQHPGYAPKPGSSVAPSQPHAVGPSADPQASVTTKWTDGNGLVHEVTTRQKWDSESVETWINRHAQAVNAMTAIFPPVAPQPGN